MKPGNDPYQVFRYSKTPAGPYAEQKWLGYAFNRRNPVSGRHIWP